RLDRAMEGDDRGSGPEDRTAAPALYRYGTSRLRAGFTAQVAASAISVTIHFSPAAGPGPAAMLLLKGYDYLSRGQLLAVRDTPAQVKQQSPVRIGETRLDFSRRRLSSQREGHRQKPQPKMHTR